MQQGGDLLVLLGLEVAEGQVLQLPLDVADAEAVRERRVDIEHFARHALALVVAGVLHRTDRTGALGELDQRDAHIIDHRHQHLAQVLDLGLRWQYQRLARIEAGADRRHAQYALDQLGDHRTEARMHVGELDLAFAYAAIEHGGDQAVLVELEVGEDLGDLQADLVARRALAPEILCRIGLLLGITGEFAGLPKRAAVERRVHAQHVVEPTFQIDAAVGVDRLKRSHLYHLKPSSTQELCVDYACILCAGRLNHRPDACQKITRARQRPSRTAPWPPRERSAETCQYSSARQTIALPAQLGGIPREGGRIT